MDHGVLYLYDSCNKKLYYYVEENDGYIRLRTGSRSRPTIGSAHAKLKMVKNSPWAVCYSPLLGAIRGQAPLN